jgi:hypothetical protein
MWACLDSNQGPLPYQLGYEFPAEFCSIWNPAYLKDFRGFRHLGFPAPSSSVLTWLQYGCSTRRGVSAVCQCYTKMFALKVGWYTAYYFSTSHPVADILVNHVSER